MRKRILFPLLVLVLLIGLFGVSARAAELDNGLVYEVYEEYVEITDYVGNSEDVVIPAEIEGKPVTVIADNAFYHCDSLTSVVIPDSVTSIGSSAFQSCYNLASVEIPDSVTSIGSSAFQSCNNLTSVVIPDSITSIPYGAFYGCRSLTSIVIPDSVTSIGGTAFYNCNSLTSVVIPDSVTSIGSSAFYICESLSSVVIGNGVTNIPFEAFYGCSSLTSVVIPDSVTSIGDSAFNYCESLSHVAISDSVTRIGFRAFEGCSSLTGFFVDTNNPNYSSDDRGVLFDKQKKKLIQAPGALADSYTIPDSVTSIGYSAFSFCADLTRLVIPDSVTSIDAKAFTSNGLTSVVIPDGVTSIGDYTFSCCDNLTSVVIPDSVTSIGSYAFYWSKKLDNVVIPDSVTSIGDRAFYGCDSLSSVVIGNSVTSISNYTFLDCYSLTSVVIPDSVTSIGESAFSGCSSLTSAVIGSSVTSIGAWAFSDCESLTSVVIPDSVTQINTRAFIGCTSLTSVFFRGNAPQIYSHTFDNVTATAYYPANDPSWTEDVMQDYGGDITWTVYDPPHTHKYKAEVIAPTCTEQGYTTYTCSCGDSYIGDYVEAPGHDYAHGTCTRCGEADPDYQEPAENPFTDVPVDSFYEEPVLWALENGITTGATEDTFNPNGTCLRAQVVTFLHRAAGNPEPSSTNNPFTDVKTSDFFYKPVLWAVEKGITNGISADRFGSYDVCNRAAVVTFLWRAAGSPEPTSTTHPFTDVKTTDFFYKPVLWAIETGITNGISTTEFGPTADCNRAQVVTFLYRAYN